MEQRIKVSGGSKGEKETYKDRQSEKNQQTHTAKLNNLGIYIEYSIAASV